MKKNLLFLLMAFFFGTSASVYAAQVESEDSGTPVTEVTLASDYTPDYTCSMRATEGASVIVPINPKYIMVCIWMGVSHDRDYVRYYLDYDQWVNAGKPSEFNGIIVGMDDKSYRVRINIIDWGKPVEFDPNPFVPNFPKLERY